MFIWNSSLFYSISLINSPFYLSLINWYRSYDPFDPLTITEGTRSEELHQEFLDMGEEVELHQEDKLSKSIVELKI